MKRRSFLKGLAAALVVPKILVAEKTEAVAPVLGDNTSVKLVTWGEGSFEHMSGRTFRKGLPKVTWRKLHEGIDMNEANEILVDLPWRETNGGRG